MPNELNRYFVVSYDVRVHEVQVYSGHYTLEDAIENLPAHGYEVRKGCAAIGDRIGPRAASNCPVVARRVGSTDIEVAEIGVSPTRWSLWTGKAAQKPRNKPSAQVPSADGTQYVVREFDTLAEAKAAAAEYLDCPALRNGVAPMVWPAEGKGFRVYGR